MSKNVYFSQGTSNEQLMYEDIIIESLQIYGVEVLYIPRTLVAKDEILGEDRLSEFKNSYPICMYFEQVDNFEGQGSYIQKFGLMVEQTATLVVARRSWNNLVGVSGNTILPNRPAEGDLIYFPLSKGLFEIKYVVHQDPFYQVGKLFVYKLQVELFQYGSERITTGVKEIDTFESLKSFSTDIAVSDFGEVTSITVTNQGSGYLTVPTISFVSTSGTGATAIAVLGTGTLANKIVSINVTNRGIGYNTIPDIVITSASGTLAAAIATVTANVEDPNNYGRNNTFIADSANILFSEQNPFGGN